MMNRVILVGRITKDPEVKQTQTNIPVVSFTLAVNRQFTDAQGEKQADFIQCVVWRKQAENLARFVKKGALLGVEGRIQTRQYEAENGTRYITEVLCDSIQFLESKGENTVDAPYKEERLSKDDSDSDEFYETSKQLAAEEDLPF
jgi:single-strand DNA-binding protein